ncbi:hypothetical protein DQ04_01011180 [Trypanosoma grayi]|uniref:hypothetical protein n=1 Tax=Trypanosoma grayi TaxID=71804 RepID=UPI0004F4326D|nr:hypothetical protein DQ04_01011180 [Trypanosoma grayi]KEG13435.1 hypothetical protein DQ04_01011180 [Trypanosoma grayi]
MSSDRNETSGHVELVTLTYTGPVPKPHPPCDLPTPDEQFRQYRAQKHQQLDEREEKQQQKSATENTTSQSESAPPASDVAGFFSSAASNFRNIAQQVALKVERASAEVTEATEKGVRQLERQLNLDRFKSNFPELSAMGEVLLADYACAAMHAGLRVNGHLHITKNYLCFSAQTSSALAQATSAVLKETGLSNEKNAPVSIHQIIPFTEIASIQLSVALDTVDQGPPFFLPLPAPNVLCTSLQLYTTKQQLFQFLGFESIAATAGAALSDAVKGNSIDRAYNYLDHAWRAATTVPLQGVKYAN